MFEYLKYKWLQLWLLIKTFFKPKQMTVTQKNIDDAIALANTSQRALYLKMQAELEQGKQVCKEDSQAYNNLNAALWLLNRGFVSVEQQCVTINDLWEQINFVKQNSCTLPNKPTVITNLFKWLITNTGLDILTNNNKQIIIT